MRVEMNRLLSLIPVALALFVIVGCDSPPRSGPDRKVFKDIANITAALDNYFMDNGRYPSETEGLEVLYKSDQGKSDGTSRKRYIESESALTDPWGRRYVYRSAVGASGRYKVYSVGVDGIDGTDDDKTYP